MIVASAQSEYGTHGVSFLCFVSASVYPSHWLLDEDEPSPDECLRTTVPECVDGKDVAGFGLKFGIGRSAMCATVRSGGLPRAEENLRFNVQKRRMIVYKHNSPQAMYWADLRV